MIDYNTLVRLVLKLSGITLIVYGALSLATYLPALFLYQGQDDFGQLFPYGLALIVPFAFGVLLWWFPATIANSVVQFDPSEKPKTGWSQEFEKVGISLLGLYLFYRGVSDIIYNFTMYRAKAAVLGDVRTPDDFPALMTATAIELVLAVLFMLRSKGIVNLLRKVRSY